MKLAPILRIHRHDQVELVEITQANLAGLAIVDKPMTGGGATHPRVRRFAFMPTAGAGRVDFILAVEAGLLRLTAEQILRQRAANDVAHADEEDPSGLGHGGIIPAGHRELRRRKFSPPSVRRECGRIEAALPDGESSTWTG